MKRVAPGEPVCVTQFIVSSNLRPTADPGGFHLEVRFLFGVRETELGFEVRITGQKDLLNQNSSPT